MKHYWELVQSKVEAMPLRERLIMFVAIAFAIIAMTSVMLLNPLLKKQKELSTRLAQQQSQMKELQAKVQEISQARKDDEHSPLRIKVAQLKQQVEAQRENIQGRRNHLVDPDKIVSLLEQVLNKNSRLQLVALETLPADLEMEPTRKNNSGQKQIFKHSIKITLRGGYLDLLQYLTAVEKAPVQMYWGDASFSVDKYPDGVLILTLYTLSLDKVWLKV
ncbi:MAG: agglutinin biogenesis protein [Gallionellales bacterium GWA2_55_18]|nr:MAG: agglutinin biogenesis protein [Gallionellales bacterium GWA2_55_18]